jgi:hypothetical protein
MVSLGERRGNYTSFVLETVNVVLNGRTMSAELAILASRGRLCIHIVISLECSFAVFLILLMLGHFLDERQSAMCDAKPEPEPQPQIVLLLFSAGVCLHNDVADSMLAKFHV